MLTGTYLKQQVMGLKRFKIISFKLIKMKELFGIHSRNLIEETILRQTLNKYIL